MMTARLLVRSAHLSALLLAAAALGACGGGVGTGGQATAAGVSSGSSSGSTSTGTVSLSGTPSATVTAGTAYSFTPTLSNSGSGTPAFSIANKPSWATFSTTNGTLSGTPSAADIGTFANIAINVNVGGTTASLTAFTITVSAAVTGTGSATLSWSPPTQNTDGSTLSDLAGFFIYYGVSGTNLNQRIQVTGAASTSYTVTGLPTGTTYFAVSAYTSSGVEGAQSSIGSKTI